MDDTRADRDLGRLLRRWRTRRGVTQRELADVSGVSIRTIRDIELGRCRRPRWATVRLMAGALGLAGPERAELEAAAGGAPSGEQLRTAFAAEPVPPPAPVDALIGRGPEVAALTESLAAGQRLVTVTGLGGVGKTRLALEVAAGLHDSARLAVLWTSAGQPGPAAPAGVGPGGVGPGGVDQLAGVLRAGLATLLRLPVGLDAVPTTVAGLDAVVGDQPTLLVLDGYPADRLRLDRLMQLLHACPGLRVLATAATPLGLPGERVFPLAPLALPADAGPAGPTGVALVPAVRLLTSHVLQVRPEFRVTAANAGSLAALARCVDGIPAALVAVASWFLLYDPDPLRDYLAAEPFEFLGALPTAVDTLGLRERLSQAVHALEPYERALLTRLDRRGGCWSVPDVAALTGRPTAGCAQLVRRLLTYGVVRPTGPGRSHFQVLNLISCLLRPAQPAPAELPGLAAIAAEGR